MTPSPHASMLRRSFRSKIPLGNWRRNLERKVTAVWECEGGIPSGTPSRGLLYQPSRVIHRTGATRAPAVSHWVSGTAPIDGIRRYSAYPNGLNAEVRAHAAWRPIRLRLNARVAW